MPTVNDYCNHDPITVKREYTVLDAAGLMRDNHVGCVVVTEMAPGGVHRPVGILTDRDIVVGALALSDRQWPTVRVDDVMTAAPVVANEKDDISDVLVTMRVKGIRRVPVVSDAGSLVGLLSFDDVLDYVQDEVSDLARLVGREQRRERRLRP